MMKAPILFLFCLALSVGAVRLQYCDETPQFTLKEIDSMYAQRFTPPAGKGLIKTIAVYIDASPQSQDGLPYYLMLVLYSYAQGQPREFLSCQTIALTGRYSGWLEVPVDYRWEGYGGKEFVVALCPYKDAKYEEKVTCSVFGDAGISSPGRNWKSDSLTPPHNWQDLTSGGDLMMRVEFQE